MLFYSAGHMPKKDNRKKAQKVMRGDKFLEKKKKAEQNSDTRASPDCESSIIYKRHRRVEANILSVCAGTSGLSAGLLSTVHAAWIA